MTNTYEGLLYRQVKELARRRGLPIRGSKDVIIARLIADDQPEKPKPKKVTTKPNKVIESPGGMEFEICGEHDRWKAVCGCADAEDTGPHGS